MTSKMQNLDTLMTLASAVSKSFVIYFGNDEDIPNVERDRPLVVIQEFDENKVYKIESIMTPTKVNTAI